MVMLKALEAAINQVETIRDHEFTFKIDDQEITLRPLRSHEETEVQRYAQVAWEGMGEGGDTAAYQEFMDRVRLSTLGFSIVVIGDTDLRNVDWLETGELDEKGQPTWVPKWEAVRDLIQQQWSKALALQVFAKFGELLERVEISASKLVKFDPSDLDEEIERVEKRLADLRTKREEHLKEASVSPVQKTQKAVAQVDQRNRQVRTELRNETPISARRAASEAMETLEDPEEAPQDPEAAIVEDPEEAQFFDPSPTPHEPPSASPLQSRRPPASRPTPAPERAPQAAQEAPQPPQGRPSSLPQTAPLPDRSTLPEEDTSQQEHQEPRPMLDEQGIVLPHEGDSFFDPSDPDAAMAAESQRQAQLHASNLRRQREQKMARQRAEAMGIPTSADVARERMQSQKEAARPAATNLDPRMNNLRQAANLQDQVFDTGAGRQQTGRPQRAQPQAAQGNSQAPATLNGKPVYKMPTQTLDKSARQEAQEAQERQHGEPAQSPVQINPTVGSRQTKFRGPENR